MTYKQSKKKKNKNNTIRIQCSLGSCLMYLKGFDRGEGARTSRELFKRARETEKAWLICKPYSCDVITDGKSRKERKQAENYPHRSE